MVFIEFIYNKLLNLNLKSSSKINPTPKIDWKTLSTSQEDYLILKENKYNIDWAEFCKNPNSIELYLKLKKDLHI
jgi:hypothetical protein